MFKILISLFLAFFSTLAIGSEDNSETTTFRETVFEIDATLKAQHYNPTELQGIPYQKILSEMKALAGTAKSQKEFIDGFREIWRDGPFSHVQLSEAGQSAEELSNYFDTLRVGGGGAVLFWRKDIAVLTINTMMGLDTIEEIDAAYKSIASKRAEALIIDLRKNEGGAFAVRPMISHLIKEPFDAGSFVAQPWNRKHQSPPTKAELQAIKPWSGWSVTKFWEDVQTEEVLRVHFKPSGDTFMGPVYILTSSYTASAAELATDALKGIGRATLVGERTAGEMLSQKPYDIAGGFHLFLPIADYYSIQNGRIEGNGVAPHVAVTSGNAMDVALNLIAKRQ